MNILENITVQSRTIDETQRVLHENPQLDPDLEEFVMNFVNRSSQPAYITPSRFYIDFTTAVASYVSPGVRKNREFSNENVEPILQALFVDTEESRIFISAMIKNIQKWVGQPEELDKQTFAEEPTE